MLLNQKFLFNFYKYKRKCNLRTLTFSQHLKSVTTKTEVSKNDDVRRLKILFFGTDHFSLPSLEQLHVNNSNNASGLGVVTSFKSPANCVRQYAEQQKLELYRWPMDIDVCKAYDLGVVVSFGHLIPARIIQSFPLGMINVHASLLPRWRGAAPIIYAIMHGDSETGVSIMKIEPKHFDIGDILAQRRLTIRENVLMPELHKTLAAEGASLLVDVINSYPKSFDQTTAQNSSLATFAPKITPSVTLVKWSEMPAQQIYNYFRALYSYKNLNTTFQNKNVQLIELQLPTATSTTINSSSLQQTGSFVYMRETKCLLVRCANATFIEVHKLRLEGKKNHECYGV